MREASDSSAERNCRVSSCGEKAGTHEFLAHLLFVGAADRTILAPGDGRMHPQPRAQPRAQLHQVQVVELDQPAAQQLLVGMQLGGHLARRVAVGQQVETRQQLRVGGQRRLLRGRQRARGLRRRGATGRTSSSIDRPAASQIRSSRGRLKLPRDRMRLTEGSLSPMRCASIA